MMVPSRSPESSLMTVEILVVTRDLTLALSASTVQSDVHSSQLTSRLVSVV